MKKKIYDLTERVSKKLWSAWFKVLVSIIISATIAACNPSKVHYLDDDFPGLHAELYAEGIVNDSSKLVQNLVMNSDGTEQYFTLTTPAFMYDGICRIRFYNETLVVDTLKFQKEFVMVGEPMLTLDDKHLYFAGAVKFPTKIWTVSRNESNDWQQPEKVYLPGDPTFNRYYPSVSSDGYLYFTTWRGDDNVENSGKMYKAKEDSNGIFQVQELNIPGTGSDPYIARDGSYLIFNSRKDNFNTINYGNFDLYISFRQKDGSWSKSINMGPEVNTEAIDMHAFVSPDNKFLFFTRRERFYDAKHSKIFWISSEIINKLKKKNNLSKSK